MNFYYFKILASTVDRNQTFGAISAFVFQSLIRRRPACKENMGNNKTAGRFHRKNSEERGCIEIKRIPPIRVTREMT